MEQSSKQEFLTLLVAQLENQNPLEPQSGSEFIAQLAQFASVEQGEQTNSLLSQIQAEQVSASNAGMAAFVGKEGSFKTDTLQIDGDSTTLPGVGFEVLSGSPKARAVITDENGKEVRSVDLGTLRPGDHQLEWDGKNSLGQAVDPGRYKIEIRLEDTEGAESTVPTTVSGTIESLDFSTGYPMLRIGGALFAPADVLSIR
ncbi:MAG: hypothetical protein JKY56_17045 [Kofleriaceae bacterium]|nr:hypothetical protein [Kofleriaceae bacterium]